METTASPVAAKASARPGRVSSRVRPSANRLRLSLVDLTFGIWIVAVPVLFGHRLLNTDGDAARHIRMGELILTQGLSAPDDFSHTRPAGEVVHTEWLARVSLAVAHRAAGPAGVTLLAGLLVATAVSLIVLFLLRRRVDPLLAYLTGAAAAVFAAAHWLARPHLFTMVAAAALLFLLEPRGRLRPWLAAPLFLAWANVHPGFVIGLALLAAAAAGEALEGLAGRADRRLALDRAARLAAACALGLAATFANPYGWSLHAHIIGVLGDPVLIRNTSEFRSLDFHGAYGRMAIVLFATIIAVLGLRGRPMARRRLLVLVLMLAAGLTARRNMPLFAIVVLPLLAVEWNDGWRRLRAGAVRRVRKAFLLGERAARPGRALPVTLVLLAILLSTRGTLGDDVRLLRTGFDPGTFPVAAIDYARRAALPDNLFNEFVWGGYLVYAWPERRIFIDGMTEYFGGELMQDYGRVWTLGPRWDETLERHGIRTVLVPAASRLAYALQREPGWRLRYADELAVILVREEAAGRD